jgi:DNA invertase Pin-like site-specific DNA recombinase
MGVNELEGLTVAIYARFSSEGQREASIDDQVRRCRRYVEEHGGLLTEAMIFADRAMSGTGADRPSFDRLLRLATSNPRQVDVIVVEDLSRLSRSAADLFPVQRLLEYAEVRLIGIADGIDTNAAHNKLTFGIKSVISDFYIAELADKTRRGLEGRALAGLATGGVAYGYGTRKLVAAEGKELGSEIFIVESEGAVVRRIFQMYLDGTSIAAIAKALNAEGVEPPRVYAKRRRRGWKDSTIRAILHNESYAGVWTHGKRRWRKLPGTNKRRPTAGANPQVFDRPHLRIIDHETWTAVQGRLAAVAAHYTRSPDGRPKGRSLPGRATSYLFSSLLHCAACGGKMVISGGGSTSYYRCQDYAKRGVCTNGCSVREDVLRASLLDELRHRLASPVSLAYARKRIAEHLGELSREQASEMRERRQSLEKVEGNIAKLVDFITQGLGTKTVSARLKTLEREAEEQRRTIASLEKAASVPIKLPTPDEMLEIVLDLERRLNADPARGREELRRLFRDGRIDLIPQPDGFYIARSEILPLVLLTTPPSVADQGGRNQVSRYSASSCAGLQHGFSSPVWPAFWVPLALAV